MFKTIQLTQGFEALVDNESFDLLNRYRWKALKAGTKVYAVRTVRSSGSRYNDKTILMHREILHCVSRIDHKNGNGLDNRKDNLRPANASQNAANSPIKLQGTSKFKGVYWNSKKQKWQAQISNGKNRVRYLGRFDDEIDAAKTYDREARSRFGQFAVINFA